MKSPWFLIKRIAIMTWKNLLVFRTRALLTVCGVFFGIVSVIATFTVNGNLSSMVNDELKRAGTYTITVGTSSPQGLNTKDAEACRKYCPAIKRAVEVSGGQFMRVITPTRENFQEITGVESDFFDIRKLEASDGRVFSSRDSQERVAVIGNSVKENLFGAQNPIGRGVVITQGNKVMVYFRVVGVLKSQGMPRFISSGGNPDETVYVPIKALRNYIGYKKGGSLLVQAKSEDDLGHARSQLESLFLFRYKKTLKVVDPREEVARNRKMVDGMVLSGIAIGILGLISGGVGIMNIMLVTVMQRRREIGLYKAIGFSNSIIKLQFIGEALAICILGSLIGLAIGVPAGKILSATLLGGFSDVSIPSLFLSVGTSLIVGVAFGYLPAQRAAGLDPVEALRG